MATTAELGRLGFQPSDVTASRLDIEHPDPLGWARSADWRWCPQRPLRLAARGCRSMACWTARCASG